MDLFKRLQLPNPDEIGFRYPHQVSGGQLQRAMTAMAMSCRPDLIIFDEPTTALDVTTQIEVLAAIRDVVDQFNTAAIYITHDLAVVAQMADRIMVLRYGNLVEEGDTRSMLAQPQEKYTADLLSVRATNGMSGHAPRTKRRSSKSKAFRCRLRQGSLCSSTYPLTSISAGPSRWSASPVRARARRPA